MAYFEFVKNANSTKYDVKIGKSLFLVRFCLATIGVCVFSALTTVGALFILFDDHSF